MYRIGFYELHWAKHTSPSSFKMVQIWNSLPQDVVNSTFVTMFKRRLDKKVLHGMDMIVKFKASPTKLIIFKVKVKMLAVIKQSHNINQGRVNLVSSWLSRWVSCMHAGGTNQVSYTSAHARNSSASSQLLTKFMRSRFPGHIISE